MQEGKKRGKVRIGREMPQGRGEENKGIGMREEEESRKERRNA